MKFDLKLDPKSLKTIEKEKSNIHGGVLEGVRKAMFYVESMSKKRFGTAGNLHVVSGRLRSSIKTSVQKMGTEVHGSIGSNVIYAAIHEFGNFRTPARPFMGPAISENIDKINDIIADSINKGVR